MDHDDNNTAGLLLTLGITLGAGIAFLFATRTGNEIRETLISRTQQAWDNMIDSQGALGERVEQLLDTIAEKSQLLVEKTETLSEDQKDSLRSAIEYARQELDILRERIARLD